MRPLETSRSPWPVRSIMEYIFWFMSARVTDKLELITSSRKLKAKVGERGTEQADNHEEKKSDLMIK